MSDDLHTEMKLFEKSRAEWLAEYRGKFVLIKETEVAGFYTAFEDAFNIGVEKYGREKFFVKEITELEPVNYVIALKD